MTDEPTLPEIRPLVSVVVPAYNAMPYIDEAVRSLLAQTYPDLEIILLDDGSTDATLSHLQRYAERCRVETHANMGQAATLNKGWSMARGEIIGYLSADDVLEPQAVASAVALLTSQPELALTYPDYRLIDEQSRHVQTVRTAEYSYATLVLRGDAPIGPGAFFRRELFDKAGGWDTTMRQMPDYEFWLRAGLFGKMQRIPEVQAGYRVHTESQTFAVATEAKAAEHMYAIEKYYARSDIPEAIRASRPIAYATASILTARLHLRAGRYRLGLCSCWQAWCYAPRVLLTRRSMKLLLNGVAGRLIYKVKRRLKLQ